MIDKIKNTLLVLLAVLSFALLAAFLAQQGTMAAYTQKYMKAVAATGETQNLFSSDLLTGYRILTSYSRISVTPSDASEGKKQFSFKIFNYLPEDRSLVNQNPVTYDLRVVLQGTGNQTGQIGDYTLQGNGQTAKFKTDKTTDSEETYAEIKDITLPGILARDQEYTLVFPETAVTYGVSFAITATVTNGTQGTVLGGLAALVSTSQGETEVKTGLTASRLIDPSTFDAYRYELTLSGSESKVKLTWPNWLQIDPLLLGNPDNSYYTHKYTTDGGITNNSDDTQSLTLTMQPGTMLVNFYQNGSELEKTWGSGEENIVTAEIVETTQTSGGQG